MSISNEFLQSSGEVSELVKQVSDFRPYTKYDLDRRSNIDPDLLRAVIDDVNSIKWGDLFTIFDNLGITVSLNIPPKPTSFARSIYILSGQAERDGIL
jgi:hypothetical protein